MLTGSAQANGVPPRIGRRHAGPLWAVHEAFVGGALRHLAASCESLVHQRRLPAEATAQAEALRHFDQLIGNTDMHLGNVSKGCRQLVGQMHQRIAAG